jgi:hypothetical protein
MPKEVRHMQWGDPRGRSVRAIVAVLAVSALLTASFGGRAAHGAPATATYFCPPAC